MPRSTRRAQDLWVFVTGKPTSHRGGWTTEYLRAQDVQVAGDRPFYPELAEALGKVLIGQVAPIWHRVPARDLVARDGGVNPAILAEVGASGGPPPRPIPVVVLADGRFWAFDDASTVLVWQAVAPERIVDVAIIPVPHQAS